MVDPVPEIDVTADVLRDLLRAQHPDLAELPLRRLGAGWDNASWRVGEDLLARLPVRAVAAALVEHELDWLPVLAPRLPVPTPVPLRRGAPGLGYPWAWSIVPWFDGVAAAALDPRDRSGWATDLADVLVALHTPAPSGAPANPYRGVSAAARAAVVPDRLATSAHPLVPVARRAWAAALAAPAWPGPPVWLHGDPHAGNLLVRDGRLAALLDFGDVTAGDPASDLATAWLTFDAPARAVFRARVDAAGLVDEPTWVRARGWAASLAFAFLSRPADHPLMAAIGEHALRQLADED